ncbi:MAG: hypothetical protein PVH29_06015 [Candidatus Zixiibacteriota bacterium]|jgi:hypothetical protein
MGKQEYHCRVWLPDRSDSPVSGDLLINVNGAIELRVFGTEQGVPRETQILNGEINNSPITLIGDYLMASRGVFEPSVIIFGNRFSNTGEISYNVIDIEFGYFHSFFLNMVEEGLWAKIPEDSPEKLLPHYSTPILLKRNGEDKTRITINSDTPDKVNSGEPNQRYEATSHLKVQVHSEKEFGLQEIIDTVTKISQFFVLGFGDRLPIRNVRAYLETPRSHEGPNPIQSNSNPLVRLTFNSEKFQYLPTGRDPVRAGFPFPRYFSYKDTGNNLTEIFEGYWVKSEEFRPLFISNLADLVNKHLYLENVFVSVATALESYYYRKNPGVKKTDKERFDVVLKAMINKMTEEERKLFEGSVRQCNNLSYREKMRNLCNENARIISSFINDIPGFVSSLKTFRDSLSHGDSISGDDERTRFVLTTYRAILLCRLICFKEIGFTEDGLLSLLSYSRGFTSLVSTVTHPGFLN